MKIAHSDQFKTFFHTYYDKLKSCDCNCGQNDFSLLDNFRLMPRQALYIFDWKSNKIPYQKGIERMLGYTTEEFNVATLAEYIHPDDGDRYMYLVKITNEWARELKPEPYSIEVVIDYRVRHKEGWYMKVMRQSTIYECCRDRTPKSAMNMLTNISGIKTDNSVNLSITNLETGAVYLENIDQLTIDFCFSNREKDILSCLKKGMSSNEIGLKLFISRHTVDTHRRNMLTKTKCRNVMEMVQLAARLGIV